MPKTKVTNKQFYEDRNTSDVLTRLVILGLLRILNKKLIYTQIWDNTEEGKETITVPFFYDFSGGSVSSERFIQDNYLNWTDDECTSIGITKMPGDYKPIPCGVISLNSTQIDAGNISNRFVMGRYTKKEGGTLKSYISFLYSIPLTYNFSVSVKCDNMNTAWKIEQAFREFFYKNKTYRINYKGTVVPVRAGFPESLTQEKTTQYQMGSQNDGYDIKLNFDISCETYQPVFDPMNERPADNTIKNLTFGIHTMNDQNVGYGDQLLVPRTDLTRKITTIGQDIILEWSSFQEDADVMYVDILYRESPDEDYQTVDTVFNNNFYHWIVPEEVNPDSINIDIIIPPAKNSIVHTLPVIKLFPDPDSKIIDETNVLVLSKGLFFVREDECQIPAIASYEDINGEIVEHDLKINLLNGMVDESNPICMSPFVYNGKMKPKKIEIAIQDHHNNTQITSFIAENSDVSNWITVC